MELRDVNVCCYLDDRSIDATTPQALEKAWQASLTWDAANLWEVNPAKSVVLRADGGPTPPPLRC
eukprot:460569-Amphidinium_carterae.2